MKVSVHSCSRLRHLRLRRRTCAVTFADENLNVFEFRRVESNAGDALRKFEIPAA